MATNLSQGVAKLAREIATDQIAQDLDFGEKLKKKADLVSPALTGTPTAPTATEGTADTQIATTEFVDRAVKAKDANLALAMGVYNAFKSFNENPDNGVDNVANGVYFACQEFNHSENI